MIVSLNAGKHKPKFAQQWLFETEFNYDEVDRNFSIWYEPSALIR